jgi:cytochrome c-type biogenesis protein CcmH/NrfF
MRGGRYFDRFSEQLHDVDALTCFDCEQNDLASVPSPLDTILSSFPRLRTLIVEGSSNAELIDALIRDGSAVARGDWKTESDLLLTDNLQSQRARRIVMLIRAP